MKNNKIIIANWKMFGNFDFISQYFKRIGLIKDYSKLNLILCPPTPFINLCKRLSVEYSVNNTISIGAQNVSNSTNIASTGEIDANILEEIGSNYCIVGHSERRQLGETNENINQKIKNLSSTNIKPILCVGEKKEDYDNKNTIKEIKEQVLSALKDIEQLNNLYIAYEPVWAIGTGKTPTKEEIENVMENIIKNANSVCNIKELKVFYGGSVNKENIEEILNYNYIDGVLVGNFSRNIDDFFDTIEEINIK